MNVKHTRKLWKKYPKLFVGKDKLITESLIPFGFECGDGWYWLIDNLCHAIQSYVNARNESIRFRNEEAKEGKLDGMRYPELQVEVMQVKEKFGALRFYINGGDDIVYGMIELAEHMSWNICEHCGSTENIVHTTGWITTLCKKCKEEERK